MITGYIKGQNLTIRTPMIAADTIDYLTAQFVFQTVDWDGCRLFSHWKCGETNYTIELSDAGKIEKEQHLNLTAGTWTVWIHGERYRDGELIQRITTDEATLAVTATGTAGGSPFPEVPASDLERINAEIAELQDKVGSGGGAASGDAMRLLARVEVPYEGTPPIIDMIDFSRKYTFLDIAEAYVAGRTITLNTEHDLVPYQYGMFWLDHLSSHVIEFHGHYRRVKDVGADVEEGWVPAVAFLREDGTLTIEDREWSGYAKQAEVDSLSKAIANLQISGLTTAQVNALDGMFKIASFTKDPTAEYTAFKAAFGIEGGGEVEPDEPDTPTKTLTSISAVYSGGDVAVGTALTDLTGIVVTATYSDGSTETVTGYTLSGEIADGSNTITVSYNGKTTAFTVTGVAESEGENNGWTDGVPYTVEWTDGYRIDTNSNNETFGEPVANDGKSVSDFLPCRGASAINVSGLYTNYGVFYYDNEQNCIAIQRVVDYSAPVPVPLAAYYVRVQCITTNKANASVAPVVLELMTESTVWESGKHYRLDWESGKQINTNAGGEVFDHPTNAKRDVSGFVLCMGAATIAIAFNLKVMVVFYDGDKSYISMGLTSVSGNTVTVPDGAVYVRIDTSGYGDGLNTWIMMQ